ncbi:MAG: hypothetical protein V3V20_08370, partial [Algisphaera sp.]
MPNSSLPTRVLIAAAIALATTSPTTHAQEASGGHGRAHDANRRSGSGGLNGLENQVDYRVRNELITGNVGAGMGFQGDVGYVSAGAFQGQLGTDDLFRFRANSIRSDVTQINVPLRRSGILTADHVVFSNFSTPQASGFQNTTTARGGVFGVSRPQPNPANDGDNAPALLSRGQSHGNPSGVTTLGVLAVPNGEALSITADPLRGVVKQTVRRAVPTTQPNGNAGQPNPSPHPSSGFGAQTSNNAPRNNNGNSTGLQLGRLQGQVNGVLQGTTAASDPQTVRDRVAAAREAIFGPKKTALEQAANKPVENAYTKLLDNVREQARGNKPGNADQASSSDLPDMRPDWMKKLTAPPETQVEAAERRMQEQLERIRTGTRPDDEQSPANANNQAQAFPDVAPLDGRAAEGEGAAATAALNALIDSLDYDVRLETLVSDREGRTADLYRGAEDNMAASQFINAERTYRQLRLEDPTNPLAQSGLIHAQLGAGMIRAASFNLRQLFEEHPELIATRYGQRLLPPSERLVWLQAELQRSIDASGANAPSGIMMAYLGHQVESRQLVRYGLALAHEAQPDDALLPLLKRIWLNDPADDAMGPPTAPAPSSSPAPT